MIDIDREMKMKNNQVEVSQDKLTHVVVFKSAKRNQRLTHIITKIYMIKIQCDMQSLKVNVQDANVFKISQKCACT